ncbi:5693_t:CDS:1 [Cetraspora pellucida]|uniref:5693_t:CDS:1 n=1 Tax=Cetraspora pellucida TaxID=1433469 RepID=A0ACA9M3A4_9GLOM|nr:5693_t:CDS:1 [Cetraspora pellucida]
MENQISSNVPCPLCSNKTFKNLKGLHLHQSRIHKQNNNHILLYTKSLHIYCVLCPGKSYKNLQGLSRHEALIHPNYNIPRAGLIPQPLEAISEFKKTLVFLIQDELKNGCQQRKQHVNAPCLESLFVGIFHGNIKRYSPSRECYYCIFNGVGAYETLSQIFKDPNWGVREFKNQQQTWVILVSQDTNEIQPKMEIQ